MNNAQHKFELAGLGKAPFTYIGYTVKLFQAAQGEPIRAGASCDYCGTSIAGCYHVRSADGHEFKVGCDCIMKVGDAWLTKIVNANEARLRREKTDKRNEAKLAKLEEMMNDSAVLAKLEALPHPMIGGKTLRDYESYMMRNAGASGRARLLKIISGV